MMNYKRIKKLGVMLMTMVLTLTLAPAWSSAAKLSIVVEVNGNLISFPDAKPFMDKSNRVQVPVRFVSEALGAEVRWNSQSKQVTVKMGEDTTVLTLGKKAFTVNGQTKQMDTVAQEKQNRTFVPLRFVSEALGAKVIWHSDLYSVEILTGLAAEQSGTSKGTAAPKDPWAEWKASRSIEGETEKKSTEGFSYYESYKSGLGGSGETMKQKEKDMVFLQLRVHFGRDGVDYNQQIKDLEEILRQKIDSKTVDNIMKYVKQKTKRDDILEAKEFSDKTYGIQVESKYWGNIIVSIWYK
ncbi:copper amine oxidase N-terminal domain-containing protein [Paenibacillus lentus]|uniref:Copper amine oxidase N-terminal domain-containing protein n=1 Tax=Paenibacillus lentus TaxID=1338368 RepID=A0A3S8RQT7_9BACL|nr:copper amine oxidase N-terminal domain-containing protein [Paenibacillus lentus]AZK45320.1 copper amine oxidase N-terminal domain-containing protein [Paenibacillus lentus]